MFEWIMLASVMAVLILVAIIATMMDCVRNEYIEFMLNNFEDSEVEVEIL